METGPAECCRREGLSLSGLPVGVTHSGRDAAPTTGRQTHGPWRSIGKPRRTAWRRIPPLSAARSLGKVFLDDLPYHSKMIVEVPLHLPWAVKRRLQKVRVNTPRQIEIFDLFALGAMRPCRPGQPAYGQFAGKGFKRRLGRKLSRKLPCLPGVEHWPGVVLALGALARERPPSRGWPNAWMRSMAPCPGFGRDFLCSGGGVNHAWTVWWLIRSGAVYWIGVARLLGAQPAPWWTPRPVRRGLVPSCDHPVKADLDVEFFRSQDGHRLAVCEWAAFPVSARLARSWWGRWAQTAASATILELAASRWNGEPLPTSYPLGHSRFSTMNMPRSREIPHETATESTIYYTNRQKSPGGDI